MCYLKKWLILGNLVSAIPPWCNGSTRVFGTLSLGSSPGGGTTYRGQSIAVFCFVCAITSETTRSQRLSDVLLRHASCTSLAEVEMMETQSL